MRSRSRWAAAAERQRRDQPGGGAGARQPRRPARDPDVDAIDPGRQVVGHVPAGRPGRCSGRRCWAAGWSSTAGTWFGYLLLIGSILAYGAVITSLGLAMATRVSRLGRAVALCVTAYVVFSIGWPILVAHAGPDRAAGAVPGHGDVRPSAASSPRPWSGPITSAPRDDAEPSGPRSPSGWCSISSWRRPCSPGQSRASTDYLGRMPENGGAATG